MENIHEAGNGDAVAQRPVPGGVGGAGDLRPAVREPLKPFALDGHEPPDIQPLRRWIPNRVRGAFLPRNSGIRAVPLLASKLTNAVFVRRGEGIPHLLGNTDPVSAVLGLPAHRRRGDPIGAYQRRIVPAGPHPRGQGWGNRMGACVPPVDAVTFKQHQRLVAVLLGAEGTCFLPLAVHHPAAVVIEAEDGWHAVPALRPLEGGGNFLGISRAAGGCSRPGAEPGGKHTGVSLSRQAAPAAQGGMALFG